MGKIGQIFSYLWPVRVHFRPKNAQGMPEVAHKSWNRDEYAPNWLKSEVPMGEHYKKNWLISD